jgi:CDP-paratose 2-epimerase
MKTILITGGAGFIGAHAAATFAEKKWNVIVLDNLSRRGTDWNLQWLTSSYPVKFIKSDVRDRNSIADVVRQTRPEVVLHLAGQVAVTTSVVEPREDFEINAFGTFNVLEAVRAYAKDAFFLNASTNKVYGSLHNIALVERNGRWEFRDILGVDELQSLDFHSPYGCSKGTADQYVIDYARIYGMRTVSFRQSCIYGTRQFGIEDQGWVAWFTIAACLGRPITIYGDGKQVRDILYVEDLVAAYQAAIKKGDQVCGQAFNLGGGSENVLSLLELISFLQERFERKIQMTFAPQRPGDQPVFVCNISKAEHLLSWKPSVSKQIGIQKLADWVAENQKLFKF